MVKSMFSGVAGLRAHQTKMDIIGNNIANVNTFGYKSARATFKDSFYQTLTGSSAAGGGFGGGNASQIGYGSQIGSVDILHTNGGYSPTDNPTDVMVSGNGFFLIGPDYGTQGLNPKDTKDISKLLLTRVGNFTFDGDGNLVTSGRNLVYGFKGYSAKDTPLDANATPPTGQIPDGTILTSSDGLTFKVTGGKIELEQTTPAQSYPNGKTLDDYVQVANPPTTTTDSLKVGMVDKSKLLPIKQDASFKGKLASISTGKDGTITGVSSDGRLITIGQLALANVPNPNALEMAQNSTYRAKENTGDVTAVSPGEDSTGLLETSGLEMANVDLSKEFTEMITTQRGFQANTRIITVTDEMLQELVNLKR